MLGRALLLAGALVALLASAASAQAPEGTIVDVVEADGVLDGTVARYLTGVLETAATDGAEVVVLQLDVRAALDDAAVRVAEAVRASEVPVVTWVGPPGARASGGGLLVAQSGHLVAAAGGTLLGPAAPVDLTAPDGAADARRYAELADRPGPWSQRLQEGAAVAVAPLGADRRLPQGVALPEGVAAGDVTVLDEQGAVEAGLLDVTAGSLPDLLLALEGREVVVGGTRRSLDLDTVTARVRFNNLGLAGQVLHAVATPTLAYLLLVGGALALAFELFQPGFGVAGVSGLALGALGAYGLAALPVRWWAMALLLAGIVALAADLALGRLGVLTAAGTAALAAGSVWLLPGPALLDVPLWVVAAVTAGVAVFFVAVMTAVLRAQGNQALAGAERVVGETGVVRSMLNPEGHVFVGGALWRARAPDEAGRVRSGTPVRVLGLTDQLTLEVVPLDGGGDGDPAPPAPRSSAVL